MFPLQPHVLRAPLALLFILATDGDFRPDDSTDASMDAVPEHHGDREGTPPADHGCDSDEDRDGICMTRF
jgi:hypothetical protein